MVVEVKNPRGKFQLLRTLLDTGTSHSVVFSKFVTLNELVDTGKGVTTWMTIAGSFTNRKVAMLHFQKPKLSTSKEVERPCQVDEHTDRESTPYALILGVDLLTKLKMVLDFEKRTLRLGDSEVEMKTWYRHRYRRLATAVRNEPRIYSHLSCRRATS